MKKILVLISSIICVYGMLSNIAHAGSDANQQNILTQNPQAKILVHNGLLYIKPAYRSSSYRIHVKIAKNKQAWARGLMHRMKPLAEFEGMLFLYPTPRRTAFWMKDTYQDLDLVFITPNWTIESMYSGMPAQSKDYYWSEKAIIGAVELRKGSIEAFGLHAGDPIYYSDLDEKIKHDAIARRTAIANAKAHKALDAKELARKKALAHEKALAHKKALALRRVKARALARQRALARKKAPRKVVHHVVKHKKAQDGFVCIPEAKLRALEQKANHP